MEVTPLESIKVIGIVEAGSWRNTGEFVDEQLDEIAAPALPNYPPYQQFSLKVVGPSMNRIVEDGEYVVCLDLRQDGAESRDGDIVVVERTRAGLVETTLKVLRMNAAGQTELWPDSSHPNHQEPIVLESSEEDTQVMIIGRVLASFKPIERQRNSV